MNPGRRDERHTHSHDAVIRSTSVSIETPLLSWSQHCRARRSIVRPFGTQLTGYYGTTEYVDVGDHIQLTNEANGLVRLAILCASPPIRESWFSGYGGSLQPVLLKIALYCLNNPISDSSWTISFPGTVLPPESTMGAVPYPAQSAIRFPPDIENLMINGIEVRAPHHEYNEAGQWVEGLEDDVRFPGPWDGAISITWSPWESNDTFANPQPLTIVLRLLGLGNESDCDCNTGCSTGFSCIDGSCVGAEGAGWVPVAELACTVDDDGLFNLQPAMFKDIWQWVDEDDVAGAVLLVSRQRQNTMVVPDALTYNGRRVSLSPIRTRVLDIIATRLDGP